MSFSVTVGIPTMNNADTIEETIRQLLAGIRPPDRIIIVDASDDETPEIVQSIATESDVPIDLYQQSDRGRGVGAARQDIYEHFEGDLLACLDTDIRVDERWLSEHASFQQDNPDVDVLSAAPIDDIEGYVTDPKTPYFFQQANCTVTAEALDAVSGWDPWLPRGEDWDMQIRLFRSGATSYARSDLYGASMKSDTIGDLISAWLNRPSSIVFLRKYGFWYVKFHPEHPLGDIASCIAVAALVLYPILLPFSLIASAAAMAVVTILSTLYIYIALASNREELVKKRDLIHILRFFILGPTALRELILGQNHPWNYGGCDNER